MLKKYSSVESDLYIEYDAEILYFSRDFGIWGGVGIYSFAVRYGHKILTYMGTSGFQFGVLIPGLLVATVLVCYYGITIYAIKRNLTVTLDLQARGYSR